MKKPMLADFFVLHMEWLGLRSGLIPRERRSFARWVVRTHPEVATPYSAEPAAFRLTCAEIQRGGRTPAHVGIGDVALRRNAQALARVYLLRPTSERGTFRDFLNGVLERCRTPRALKRFLERSSQSSDPSP